MEAQGLFNALVAKREKIHPPVPLLFSLFSKNARGKKKVSASPLEAELLNVTFSYEVELKCSPRGDEGGKIQMRRQRLG